MPYPGAIAGGDLTTIRYPRYRIRNLRVDVFPLVEFASATIDTLPADYPFADIPVTGASANWGTRRRGEYVRIFDGSELVGDGVWRKNAAGTTDYFYGLGVSRGDTGKAFLQAEALAAGMTIRSYSVRVPKSFMSRLDGSTYYKKWDVAFSSFDPSPQANIGQHRAAKLASGDTTVTLEFELDTSTSTSWGAGTLTPEWVLPSGCSYETGFDEFDNPTQIKFPPGVYVLPCIITDSSRVATERNYRYVWVSGDDGGGNAYTSFSDEYKVVGITGDTRTRGGRTITFECLGTPDLTKIYTGAPVLMTWDDQYSDDDGATWETPAAGTTINNVFGYVRRWSASNQGNGVESFTFTIETPLLYSQSLPFAPQYLIEATSPSEWWEVPTGNATAAFIPFYVGDLHSRFFQELHDYYPGDGADYVKSRWDISGDNIADAMRTAARPFLGNLGNSSDGSLWLSRNLLLETTANRTAAANRITIDENDVTAPLQYELNEVMEAGETEGACFIYSGEGDDVRIRGAIYRAGKGARMQGVRIDRMPDFIAETAVEGKSRVGHYHQMTNSPVKIVPFNLLGGRDVIDPAWGLWLTSDMTAFDPLATPNLYNGRMVIDTINTQWSVENGSWTKILSVNAIPETFGQPATQKTKTTWGGGGGITPSTSWCHTWDFLTAQGDWVTCTIDAGGSACNSSWALGVGWSGDLAPNADRNYIRLTFPETVYVKSVSFTVDTALSGADKSAQIGTVQGTADLYDVSPGATGSTFSVNPNQNMSSVFVGVQKSGTGTNFTNIVSVTICGTGIDPFA